MILSAAALLNPKAVNWSRVALLMSNNPSFILEDGFPFKVSGVVTVWVLGAWATVMLETKTKRIVLVQIKSIFFNELLLFRMKTPSKHLEKMAFHRGFIQNPT